MHAFSSTWPWPHVLVLRSDGIHWSVVIGQSDFFGCGFITGCIKGRSNWHANVCRNDIYLVRHAVHLCMRELNQTLLAIKVRYKIVKGSINLLGKKKKIYSGSRI